MPRIFSIQAVLIVTLFLICGWVFSLAYQDYQSASPWPVSKAFEVKYPNDEKMNSPFCKTDGTEKSETQCLLLYANKMQREIIEKYSARLDDAKVKKIGRLCAKLKKQTPDRTCFVPHDFEQVIRRTLGL